MAAHPNLSSPSSDKLSLQLTPCWQNDRWDVEAFWPQQASKGELVCLENQATISLFILHSYISGGHIGMRGKCVGKVTAAPGVWRKQSGKTTNGSSVLFLHLDTAIRLLLSPAYSPFLLHWPLLLSSILGCYGFLSVVNSFSFSCLPRLFFHLPPSRLVLCISLLLSHSLLFHTPLPSDVSPSLSLPLCFSSCLFGHGPISPIGLVAV